MFLRLADVQKAQANKSVSLIYREMSEGLFPPSIKLGRRFAAWLSEEIEAVNAARVRGASDDDIKKLVTDLVAARHQKVAA